MTPWLPRRRWLLGTTALAAAIAVACGGGDESVADTATPVVTPPAAEATPTPAVTPVPLGPGRPNPLENIEILQPDQRAKAILEASVIAAIEREFPKIDITKRTVRFSEIVNSLPRDAIRALDAPNFDTVADAGEWLDGSEPVIVLEIDGDARAYPLRILVWHELVNDVVGGRPVMVTYCPLCNTAITFERTVDGEVRTFGVSGKLRRNDLIMYDVQTETLWQQITGEGIVGAGAGRQLEFVPSQIVSFDEFRQSFADALVLNEDTGSRIVYGVNPYPLYDTDQSTLFPNDEFDDGRLEAKERVLTVELGGEPAAFPFIALSRELVITAEIGGVEVVAFWQPGAVSPLDSEFIIGSRNVGSAGAFLPVLDGERLTFEARDGAIVDTRTGSEWNVLGKAVSGPLAGAQLEQVLSGNHFWFAWSIFEPDTRVIFESDPA